jgi:transcriptional regulator with XRE-family HTH domain
LIAELADRPGWNQTKLAESIGVGRNTIGRWISGESANVTSASIRLVATASGIDYETASRAAVGAQMAAEEDRTIREVMDEDMPAEAKQELIDLIRARRAADDAKLHEEIEFVLRSRRAAS